MQANRLLPLLLLLGLAPTALAEDRGSGPVAGHLKEVRGAVHVVRGGVERAARMGEALRPGDRLEVATAAEATVDFAGRLAAIAPGTRVTIRRTAGAGRPLSIALEGSLLWQAPDDGQSARIEIGAARLELRGAEVAVRRLAESRYRVLVRSGRVGFSSGEDRFDVPVGEGLLFRTDGRRRMPVPFDATDWTLLSSFVEVDGALPFAEAFGTKNGLSDAPLEGPENNNAIGIGGGSPVSGRNGKTGEPLPEHPIDRALAWLAAHQSKDGRWEAAGFGHWCRGKRRKEADVDGAGRSEYDVGVTGLALLAFLRAGYKGRGKHPFAEVVSRGLRYLKNVQDGEGFFGSRTATQQSIYNHAIATWALVEAFRKTASPIYKGAAQRGLDMIALARNPYFAWRYGIKPGDNDTSVTAWMMLALCSAKDRVFPGHTESRRGSLRVDSADAAYEGALAWIQKVTDPDYGRVGYVQRGTGPARPPDLVDRFPGEKSEAMTAVGVLLRRYAGETWEDSKAVQLGEDLLDSLRPVWNEKDGSIDLCYWFFGTLALEQRGGRSYSAWGSALRKALETNQRVDGGACGYAGSWDPLGPWGADGGRVYATALAALSLQVLENAR